MGSKVLPSNGFLSVPSNSKELQRLLAEYEIVVAATDIIDANELHPIQQGLFGEVGGIMATAKKVVREKSTYSTYHKAAQEEFGDTFWYLAAMCRRQAVSLVNLMCDAFDASTLTTVKTAVSPASAPECVCPLTRMPHRMDEALMHLGHATAELLNEQPSGPQMQVFAQRYVGALLAAGLHFEDVVRANMHKVRGAFIDPQLEDLVDFDREFEPDEQLPRNFEIRISQRASGKSYLQWHGVFIGDPLTDNIGDQDGYRFHDVFHFANAAILHWSPVMRALIKQKRKSIKDFDEEQDGGRAIVVEEGLTAWIFSRAKELNYFAGETRVSLGILKTIQEFVAGYEVEQCPLKLWERAILGGYDVFRHMSAAKGGVVIGDREARTLRFEPLEATK